MSEQARATQRGVWERKEEILSKVTSIAAIPAASVELIRLLQDPEVSNARVVRAIEYDPSLTSNLLRLANSAYFGYPRAVSTIREAIFLLGRNEVFQLVVASIVGKMTRQPAKGYGMSPGQLWDHLMGVAATARRLGEALQRRIPMYAFTAGLLHDIGKVVLGTFGEVDAAPILARAQEKGIPVYAAEQEILGIDHAEVGASLLERWNLPAYLAEVVRWHHDPDRDPGQAVVARLIQAADALCILAGVGLPTASLGRHLAQEVVDTAGLPAGLCESVMKQAMTELEELRDIFGF